MKEKTVKMVMAGLLLAASGCLRTNCGPSISDAPERFPKSDRADVVIREKFDLSRSRFFAFDAYVEDPGAVHRGTCYFLSGTGACGVPFALSRPGWNRIVVDRAQVGSAEKGFAGWSTVRGIKVTFWWNGLRTTKVDARKPQTVDNRPMAAVIDNGKGGERTIFFRRMCKSFDGVGIPATVIAEADLSPKALEGLGLVALPGYDSHRGLGAAGEKVLADFEAHGGKVLRKTWKGLIAGECADSFAEVLKSAVPAWAGRLDAATAERRRRAEEAARTLAASEKFPDERRWVACHEAFGPPVDGWDWDRAAKFLSENGINGLEANLCRGGVAAYASKVLPVDPRVKKDGDQLKAFVAACRKYGLESRAWRVCWNTSHPRFSTEESRAWISNGWGQVSFEGKRHESYLCPSLPENRQREVDAMVELAASGVDVIAFDYIRYPDRNHCFCDRCRAAFERAIGEKVADWPKAVRADERLARLWKLFRDERISFVVRETSRRVRRDFPKVKVCAAVVHGDGDGIVKNLGQPWADWVKNGWLDYIVPMDYFEDVGELRVRLREQIRTVGVDKVRPILGPSLWMDDGANVARLAEQVKVCREEGVKGFGFFAYDYRTVRDLPKMGFAAARPLRTPETSKLFEKHVDPQNGVVSYRLRSGLLDENQQSIYFTADSMTENGRFLLFTASKNEFAHPDLEPVTRGKLDMRTALVDFSTDEVVDLGRLMGIPFVDVKSDQVWYVRKNGNSFRGGAICRRDLKADPRADVVECEIPPEIFAGVTNEHWLTTHLTLTQNRRKAFVALSMDDRFEQGMINFDTGRWEKWGSTPFYANHDQLNPADDNLGMFAWEECWTGDGKRFSQERGWYPRLWLCRPDGTREMIPPRIVNCATHERWTQDGKGFYYCACGPEGGSGVMYCDLATGDQTCVCPRRCMHAAMTRDRNYVVYDNYQTTPKYYRGRAFEIGFWNRETHRGIFVQPMGEAIATAERPSILHPDGHPAFVGNDRYVVWTVTHGDGHMDVALAPVGQFVARTADPSDPALFTGALRSGVEAVPGDGSVDFHDVLVVGGTLKGVETAIRERDLDGYIPERVQLLTPFPYLGEDLAGTLELGFGETPPKEGLRRRLWENATDHAGFEYWETPPCRHPQFVFRNDRHKRLSEPKAPRVIGDAVWHDTDVDIRCRMDDPSQEIATAEVVVFEGRHSHGGVGATASVVGEILSGPRKGETVPFVRRPSSIDIGNGSGERAMTPVSYVAEIGGALGEFGVKVCKDPSKECQYVSRVWFHLANPAASLKVPSPLKVKRTLDRALVEAGVDFLTSVQVEDVIRTPEGKIVGVKTVSRSGRRTYRAKKVIDATRYRTLENFGRKLPAGPEETFSRVVITSGAAPSAPGMRVERLPGTYPLVHANETGVTARVYRCTMRLPMKDGSFASFAAAEAQAREMTWSDGLHDDADLLVWHPSAAAPAAGACVTQAFDVVVVGGGTSGTPTAVAAARAGAKVLLVEYLNVLGGVGTDGMIVGYYDGNHCGFTEEFKAKNRTVGYYEPAGYYPRAETWRRLCRDAGVTVWFGAAGTGVLKDGDRVTGVTVGTEFGPVAVRAACVVDATGNSDIAAAAGAATDFIDGRELALQSAGQAPQRLSNDGVNSDFGYLDDASAEDLWLFMLRARAGAPDAWDLAKMPDSRERRRIVSDYRLGAADVAANRPFPDTVVQPRSRQDAHGVIRDEFGYIAEDSVKELKKLSGKPRAQFDVNVPLRSLLPKGISGLAVVGLGAGVERDVQPMIRMQADLMNMGYAVGCAAALAAKNGGEFRTIDLAALKKALVKKGILRPETLDWTEDTDVSSDAAVAAAVRSVADNYRGSHVLWRAGNRARALPLLRAAYAAAATDRDRQIYATILAFLGDDAGVDTLVEIVEGRRAVVPTRTDRNYGESRYGGDSMNGFVLALGKTRSPKALKPLLRRLSELSARSSTDTFRAVVLALADLGDPAAAPALARKLREDGLHGFAVDDWRKLAPQGGYGGCPEIARCVRELTLARALFLCGDSEGLGRRTLEAYAKDPRGILSAHAKAVLASVPPRLFFAGDSTLDDYGRVPHPPYASWGTELEKSMKPGCRVVNHARGGRSTKSFVDEDRWNRLIAEVRPGDFVAFAFGHNDQKTEPRLQGRLYAPPQGLYKEILRRFVRETRAKGATPIVMTPIVRATFDAAGKRLVERGDAAGEALADYAQAAREVAAETGSDLVDMYRLTHDLLERLGKDGAHKFFVISTGYRKSKDGEPVKDVTHPIQAGAEAFSKLFLEEVKARNLAVAACFR